MKSETESPPAEPKLEAGLLDQTGCFLCGQETGKKSHLKQLKMF